MTTKTVTQEKLFESIDNRKPGDYKVCCLNPDHADTNPSMTITVTTDDIFVKTCFGAGASMNCVEKAQDVLKDMGLWYTRREGTRP